MADSGIGVIEIRSHVLPQHPGWAARQLFVHYKPIPALDISYDEAEALSKLSVEQEEWIDRMNYFIRDLDWLLRLPHHRFWSQIVYDVGIHRALNSFLTQAPRFYDSWSPYTTPKMIELLQEAFHLVFLIYIRMATFKESEATSITPKEFASLIYEYYIFDITKILDLCVLYYKSNLQLLTRMIENIFKYQPKYLEDLKNIVPSLLQLLGNVANQFGLNETSNDAKIAGDKPNFSVTSLSWFEFEDTTLFLLDTSVTLSAFLEVYPAASEIFYEMEVPAKIASYYDFVIPIIQEELHRRLMEVGFPLEKQALQKKLTLIKGSLLKIFRNIATYKSLHLLKNQNSSIQEFHPQFADDYFELLMNVLSEKRFLSDYQKKFPVEDDIDYFLHQKVSLDMMRIQYVLDGIHSDANLSQKKSLVTNGLIQDDQDAAFCVLDEMNATDYGDGACASSAITGVHLDSLVSQIHDLLPGWDNDFLKVCLEYYNYSVETVINSILEDTLPPSLTKIDKTTDIMKSESLCKASLNESKVEDLIGTVKNETTSSLLSTRKNIFDNDEFDVFTRDTVDTQRVFKGKKPLSCHFDTNKQLDKNHIEKTMELFNGMCIEADNENDMNIYNDEYDDTYDENTVGAYEPDRFHEHDVLNQRPIVTPRALSHSHKENDSSEEENDDDYAKKTNGYEHRPEMGNEIKDCFVQNPEEIRKKAEERRQQFEQNKHRNRKFTSSSNRNYDVKGKPKGQGQDEAVSKNRSYKERQKGSRANHNRRNQSDWKRSRGMIPS